MQRSVLMAVRVSLRLLELPNYVRGFLESQTFISLGRDAEVRREAGPTSIAFFNVPGIFFDAHIQWICVNLTWWGRPLDE